ncbi:MAG: GIY-YIG nuclease family protein [Dehalococcoidia bacterium]|nr:MAG: GIY-YIG nuclease family protein [Dehalococcoidia bacterium]
MNGIYVVIAEVSRAVSIPIGKRRKNYFKKGFYCYVGSALRGLEKRMARHCSKEKKLHWHIDYFLVIAKIRSLIYAKTTRKVECALSRILSRKLDSIRQFGCSDCTCKSHLFFAQDFDRLVKVVKNSYHLLDLQPIKYEGLPSSIRYINS